MIPRAEYPRPSARRDDWFCLNGEWQFEIDQADTGLERGLLGRPLNATITVPFAPESPLSGVGVEDFMDAVWYRRRIDVPAEWAGRRVLVHFQACDHDATVWVDGVEAVRHRGGSTPFSVEIPATGCELTLRARDDTRSPGPRGKQSQRYAAYDCLYPRTTGIWQTVWMEPVPASSLKRPRITPDVPSSRIRIEQAIDGPAAGLTVKATLSDAQGEVAAVQRPAGAAMSTVLDLDVPETRVRLWSIEDPHLYDLVIELRRGDEVVDRLESYAGLRSISIDGAKVLLNGRPVFQRLILDQGYWPDGGLTAPSDAELEADVRRGQEAGFNGARMHQKVAEERWLYHADRLGYLVWGEFPDWGCRTQEGQEPTMTYVGQWLEVLMRDYSHPSIVGWCALNETFEGMRDHPTLLDDATLALFLAAKAMDATRPVLDASGYSHRVPATDVYDVHDYDQNPATFRERWDKLAEGEAWMNGPGGDGLEVRASRFSGKWSQPWAGQPFMVSEFGGIWWNPDDTSGWGYGSRPASVEEYLERFDGLCAALLDNPYMFGYCFTQLTDVYQEHNGLYTFDRRPKFDLARLRSAQERPAAIEK